MSSPHLSKYGCRSGSSIVFGQPCSTNFSTFANVVKWTRWRSLLGVMFGGRVWTLSWKKRFETTVFVRKMPPKVPMHLWSWPEKPWSRVHTDHAGPVMGKTVLMMVDAPSRWIEVQIVSSKSSAVTIQKLKETLTLQYMVYLKYWCQIMGPPLPTGVSGVFEAEWSEEFAHSSIPPCIKWTCQKAVQTVKGLKKMNESWKVRLLRFLIKYRVTPQQTNGIVPAELLMCRRIRTHLDLLDPTVQQQVKEWLISQKERRDANAKPKNFEQGDWVLSRNFGQEPKWLHGTVSEKERENMVKVKLDDGTIWRHHQYHLIKTQIQRTAERNKREKLILGQTVLKQNLLNK